jgi:hypothetical protein
MVNVIEPRHPGWKMKMAMQQIVVGWMALVLSGFTSSGDGNGKRYDDGRPGSEIAFPGQNELNVSPPMRTVLDTLPADFPLVQVLVNDNPTAGFLFMAPIYRSTPRFAYLTIRDGSMDPVYYRREVGSLSDFSLQPNGLLTYFNTVTGCYYAMDNSYSIVDSFRCASGYPTDGHDLQVYKDGHAMLMSYNSRIVDMSRIVPGGNPAATVIGLVLQEQDENKNVVFEWSSWDHFSITDATHEDLTAATIDYVHANAFDRDTDGNILLSSRHLDEITKINRQTGAIMWRLGGRNNQFTFINDTLGFSHQHDIRRLDNGNITLFDNGNFHSPPFSRAVEYRLDETRMTAELMWQFRNTPDIYAFATGNVQRLPGGNTLISWGTENIITEVRPDGSKAQELALSPQFSNYRALRFPSKSLDVRGAPEFPQTLTVLPPYPNPFNPTTTIRYTLPDRSYVTLVVYDITGRSVTTLVDQIQEAGEKSVQFDAGGLSSGVYIYRLSAGPHVASGKLLLIR